MKAIDVTDVRETGVSGEMFCRTLPLGFAFGNDREHTAP